MLMAENAFDEGYNGLFFILESKFMNGGVFDEEAAFTWLVGRTMGDTQLHELLHRRFAPQLRRYNRCFELQ